MTPSGAGEIASSTVVFFRVEASLPIGAGHLFRCYTLAQGFRDAGISALFLMSDETASRFRDHVEGFEIIVVPSGCSEDGDARTSCDIIAQRPERARIVFVDHYSFGKSWEGIVRPQTTVLAAIDDLGREHTVDLIIDHNLPVDGSLYSASPGAELLLGTEYALLRSEITSQVSALRPLRERPNRVFICFGGSDPALQTPRALRVLIEECDDSKRYGDDLLVTVVVGAAYEGVGKLEELVKGSANVEILVQPSNFAERLASSRLAIGGGGIMHFERCVLGVPSIVITIADNQVRGTEALHRIGCTTYLGPATAVSDAQLADALRLKIADEVELERVSARCRTLVDGRGVERIVNRTLALAAHGA